MDPTWGEAVVTGDLAAVRSLLAAGAPVDARDRHGQTALMLAAHHGHGAGHGALIDALIAAGAALDVTAKFRSSALMLAVANGSASHVFWLRCPGLSD